MQITHPLFGRKWNENIHKINYPNKTKKKESSWRGFYLFLSRETFPLFFSVQQRKREHDTYSQRRLSSSLPSQFHYRAYRNSPSLPKTTIFTTYIIRTVADGQVRDDNKASFFLCFLSSLLILFLFIFSQWSAASGVHFRPVACKWPSATPAVPAVTKRLSS
jgi:hypothetical protein